jgi:hypothetical protein
LAVFYIIKFKDFIKEEYEAEGIDPLMKNPNQHGKYPFSLISLKNHLAFVENSK